MDVLSDSFIKALMEVDAIRVSGAEDAQMQPASVDFTLGRLTVGGKEVEPASGYFRLEAGRPYYFYTRETLVNNTEKISVQVAQRSTLARALVNIIDLSGEYVSKIDGRFRGTLHGWIMPKWFPIEIKKGAGIEQAVFLAPGKSPEALKRLYAGAFLVPKRPSGYLDVSDGVSESELFEEVDSDDVSLGSGCVLKARTEGRVDYSDGKKAALVYRGGMFQSPAGPMCANNGQARFIDPGYNGSMTSVVPASGLPKMVSKKLPIMEIIEYSVKGRVERLYGSKGLGSHYSGR